MKDKTLTKGEAFTLRRATAKAMFEEEKKNPEVMKIIRDAIRTEVEALTEDTSIPRTPVQLQIAIDDIPGVLQSLLEWVAYHTGWKFTILGGGPEPRKGGDLTTVSYHVGSGPLDVTYGDFHPKFDEQVVDQFTAYLAHFFPDELRASRSLNTTIVPLSLNSELDSDYEDDEDDEEEGKDVASGSNDGEKTAEAQSVGDTAPAAAELNHAPEAPKKRKSTGDVEGTPKPKTKKKKGAEASIDTGNTSSASTTKPKTKAKSKAGKQKNDGTADPDSAQDANSKPKPKPKARKKSRDDPPASNELVTPAEPATTSSNPATVSSGPTTVSNDPAAAFNDDLFKSDPLRLSHDTHIASNDQLFVSDPLLSSEDSHLTFDTFLPYDCGTYDGTYGLSMDGFSYYNEHSMGDVNMLPPVRTFEEEAHEFHQKLYLDTKAAFDTKISAVSTGPFSITPNPSNTSAGPLPTWPPSPVVSPPAIASVLPSPAATPIPVASPPATASVLPSPAATPIPVVSSPATVLVVSSLATTTTPPVTPTEDASPLSTAPKTTTPPISVPSTVAAVSPFPAFGGSVTATDFAQRLLGLADAKMRPVLSDKDSENDPASADTLPAKSKPLKHPKAPSFSKWAKTQAKAAKATPTTTSQASGSAGTQSAALSPSPSPSAVVADAPPAAPLGTVNVGNVRKSTRDAMPSEKVKIMKGLSAKPKPVGKENVPPNAQDKLEKPMWYLDATEHFHEQEISPEWTACVREWQALEEKLGFGLALGRGHLPCIKQRPVEWQEWTSKGRDYSLSPSFLNPGGFGYAVAKWWKEMQPAGRQSSPDAALPLPISKMADQSASVWSSICKGGNSGLVTVVTLLWWWGVTLPSHTEWQDDSTGLWKDVVADVTQTLAAVSSGVDSCASGVKSAKALSASGAQPKKRRVK